jgi:hypothetical protein
MGTAYTPGLKVSSSTVIRKTRRLPLKGEVVVRVGDEVLPEQTVARTHIPGILRTVRAAEKLGIESEELPGAMVVEEGTQVKSGQLLASMRSFFGMFKSECHAPVDGVVEMVNKVTGHIGIRETPSPIEVNAYVRGRVVEVLEDEGVVVETSGALIQGIFGIGGEGRGPIKVIVNSPDEPITEQMITPDLAGKVIAGGSNVSGAALRRAAELGVTGIVVGAVVDRDLIDFLGYDIGVAITGHEEVGITLVLTEGFGTIRMADRTFRLLRSLEGEQASINGATQIRAGVIRPEVVVPRDSSSDGAVDSSHDLDLGTPIRIIREPYFGLLATVSSLPSALQVIPSGAHVRVLEADLQGSGERVTVPRANVEIIEE